MFRIVKIDMKGVELMKESFCEKILFTISIYNDIETCSQSNDQTEVVRILSNNIIVSLTARVQGRL